MSIRTSDQPPEYQGPEPSGTGQPVSLIGAGMVQPGGASGVGCESCGAPVAVDQRYCVECGAHRVGVNDPAAAFMNRAPARSQRSGRAVVVSSRTSRLISALMLALIPIAIGVGVLIGRSSNNRDPALLKAIEAERAQVVKVGGGAVTVKTVAASGTATSQAASKQKSPQKKSKSTSTAGSHKTSGAVGSTSSSSEKQQSAKIVKKLQKSTGLSYLDPLPAQVGGG